MGRSQETFNKKENEKKKQKKKKEKEERREERKASANNNKGDGLDAMIAYVDEDGNITSTPPDPKQKKKEINQEDIQLGAAKRENIDEDVVRTGIVSFFNESKGYGFIRDKVTQESIFVHMNGLTEPIKENNKVTFEIEKGPKGLNAVNVKKAS
jgi:cold shock CspA family protein